MAFMGRGAKEKRKAQAELDFWVGMVAELTRGCTTEAERSEALLRVCSEIAFPRYKFDLHLADDSFEGKRVLDVGCGPHCGLIGFTGAEKFGVDHLVEEYREIGYPLERHGVEYRNAKSEALPFEDDFFDAVLCVNALDHVDDLDRTVVEIARVLKPGGAFLGQLNFHDAPTPTEPISLSHEILASLFGKHGLEIGVVRYQYTLEDGHEDRYFYEAWKGGRRISPEEYRAAAL
jgi:ubiquinone/menaquinone biosynthesis C-methylase UbiE